MEYFKILGTIGYIFTALYVLYVIWGDEDYPVIYIDSMDTEETLVAVSNGMRYQKALEALQHQEQKE